MIWGAGCKSLQTPLQPGDTELLSGEKEACDASTDVVPPKPYPQSTRVRYAWTGQAIHFHSDQSTSDPSWDEVITQAVAWMEMVKDAEAVVTGHTDDRGSITYNSELGLRRARYIAGRLIDSGIAASRITTCSDGESSPAVPNSSEANRMVNRRVIVRMIPSVIEAVEWE